MSGLTASDAATLRKVIGLFDSDIDGEVLSAIRAARTILDRSGMRLAELFAAPTPRPALQPIPVTPATAPQRQAWACLSQPHLYNAKELSFLRSMEAWRNPSANQLDWLRRLHNHLVANGQARAA